MEQLKAKKEMMKTYISNKEIDCLLQAPAGSLQREIFDNICKRVKENTVLDTLKQEKDAQTEWYHLVWSRLSEACFVYRVNRDEKLGQWIHNRIMEIVALSEDAWIGPWFRKRVEGVQVGTLETSSIARAICEACLNAKDVFSEEELTQIYNVLSSRALVLLRRHIEKLNLDADETYVKGNWFMVTNCGYGMTAAVLGLKEEVQHSLEVLKICLSFFNKDSHGETLHYTDYAASNICHLAEVLYRLGYISENELPLDFFADKLAWFAESMQDVQYTEEEDKYVPIVFNFGDCNLHMCFHADKLIQIAARMQGKDPEKAGLASWLFALPYKKDAEGNKSCCADYYSVTYLGLLMIPYMATPISPKEAKLPLVKRFEAGHILARDNWDNPRMTLAIAAGADEMNISCHKHPDQNSFLLTVGKERMLIDPGVCCYRLWSWQNAKHERSHNVTSLFKGDELIPQQLVSGKFNVNPGRFLNQLKIFERFQDVWIIVSDAVKLYDTSIVEKAVRIWVVCMPNMMFVADYVVSKEPVRLETSFVLNNEDNKLRTNVHDTYRLVFRRGLEAMKLFHALNIVDGKESQAELVYDWTFAHHRASSQPNQPGQAKEGSGLIYRWVGKEEGHIHNRLHTFMMDEENRIQKWHMRKPDDFIRLEAPDLINTLDFKFTEEGFAVRRNNQVGFWSL